MMTLSQFLLNKIAEECNELAQIALKTAQFGLYETNPLEPEEGDNITRMQKEFNDLVSCIGLFNLHAATTISRDDNLCQAKADKVVKYLQYSQSLGFVRKGNIGELP